LQVDNGVSTVSAGGEHKVFVRVGASLDGIALSAAEVNPVTVTVNLDRSTSLGSAETNGQGQAEVGPFPWPSGLPPVYSKHLLIVSATRSGFASALLKQVITVNNGATMTQIRVDEPSPAPDVGDIIQIRGQVVSLGRVPSVV
jgi:hypothetical protein